MNQMSNKIHFVGPEYGSFLSSMYDVSYLYSKLIPYFAVNNFFSLKKKLKKEDIKLEEFFINFPYIGNVEELRSINSRFKGVLGAYYGHDYGFAPSLFNPKLFTIFRNGIFSSAIIHNNIIFTYENFVESAMSPSNVHDNVSFNSKPIVLLTLCFSREIIDDIYNINRIGYCEVPAEKSILVVNTNPRYEVLNKRFKPIIKKYADGGIKNILYTDDPSSYIIHQNPITNEMLFPDEQKELINAIVKEEIEAKIVEQQTEGPQF